ncbi:MAG: hypothetical protein COB35_12760 [Gammaproteobacteria bacterium]|nr:MAG: hypothetical protein COB35_12760 [Gammaproteobacteria bacterium]
MLLKELIPDFEQVSENIEYELIPELKTIAHYFEKKPYLKLICKAADLLEALSYFQFAKGQDTQHNEVITYKLNEALELISKTGQKQANHLNWNEISKIKEDIINGNSAIINFENIKLFSPH